MNVPLSACQISFVVGLSSREDTIYYKENVGHVTILEIAKGEQPYQPFGSGILMTKMRNKIVRLNT